VLDGQYYDNDGADYGHDHDNNIDNGDDYDKYLHTLM
jgi:hypothetical protein